MNLIEFSLGVEEIAQNFFCCINPMDDRQDVISYSDDQLCDIFENTIGKDGIVDFWIETKVRDSRHLLSEITFQRWEFEKAIFTKVEIIIPVHFEIPE